MMVRNVAERYTNWQHYWAGIKRSENQEENNG
jgi:hypothetical protein